MFLYSLYFTAGYDGVSSVSLYMVSVHSYFFFLERYLVIFGVHPWIIWFLLEVYDHVCAIWMLGSVAEKIEQI